MLSIPGVGEAMFSITSSPTNKDYKEFSIKKCGCLTDWLHQMEVGQQITIRGPYGHPFPVDTEFVGKDLLFIAGGIGLAPLRSVINYCRHYRDRYGKIDIVYGSRSKDDLVDYQAELDRLTKEKKRLEGEVERVVKKLSNQGFISKAPEKVINEEKEKQVKYEEMLAKVTARLELVSAKVNG